MKKLFFICLIIFTIYTSNDYYTINLKELHNSNELLSENQFNAIPLDIAFGFENDTLEYNKNIFFQNSIRSLEIGKQIKSHVIVNPKKKELLYKELTDKNIQFYIYFYIKNNMFIWKLYNVSDKKFIKGKSYKYIENSIALLRTISIDIWYELFADTITPYHSFLCFLNTSFNGGIQDSYIEFCHPLLFGFEKKIFKINQNILDLASIDSSPRQSLLFSMQSNLGTSIMKLNSHGNIIPIINNPGMLISPSVNHDGLFYIQSGSLKRYYYNKLQGKFCSQLLDKNFDFASVYAILNKHSLLVSRNRKIYMIDYEIDKQTNELIIKNAKKITENECNSVSMTYDYINDYVIVSQKINGFYQLFAYGKNYKKILTTTKYNKQDPSVSPCGNYIAYIAQTIDGARFIEVINKYSGEVIRVTKEAGEYRFPVWIIR